MPLLLFAFLGGPSAYAAHLMAGYWMAATCTRLAVLALYPLTVVAAAGALVAAVVAYRALPPPDPSATGRDLRRDVRVFMAGGGLFLSLLSLAIILLAGLPVVVLGGCG